MRRPKRIGLGAALALAVTGTAGAATLDCMLPSQTTQNWIMDRIVIQSDFESGVATVTDAVIEAHAGAPVEARIAVDNPRRTTYRWSLRNVQRRSGFAPSIHYALSYEKDTGRANVYAISPELEEYNMPAFVPKRYGVFGTCGQR